MILVSGFVQLVLTKASLVFTSECAEPDHVGGDVTNEKSSDPK